MKFYPLFILFFCHVAVGEAASSHDAHTHGQGEMTLVYDQRELIVNLETPAVNLLGFEHEPENDSQWKAVARISESLKSPDTILALTPDCKLEKAVVDIPYSDRLDQFKSIASSHTAHHDHKDDHHKEDSHAHHEHESDTHKDANEHHKGHDEHKDHDHKEHHAHDDHKTETHSDIALAYTWTCDKAPKVDILLFNAFPGFEKLLTQWVVNSKQGFDVLTHKNRRLDF